MSREEEEEVESSAKLVAIFFESNARGISEENRMGLSESRLEWRVHFQKSDRMRREKQREERAARIPSFLSFVFPFFRKR